MAYHAERVRFHTVGKNPFRQPTDSDHSGWPSYEPGYQTPIVISNIEDIFPANSREEEKKRKRGRRKKVWKNENIDRLAITSRYSFNQGKSLKWLTTPFRKIVRERTESPVILFPSLYG